MSKENSKPMKFLGAGMARRVYQSGPKACIKIPIEGREGAGTIQNKNEFNNIALAEALGLKCFPKVISASKDFKKMKVRKYEPVSDKDWIQLYANDMHECLGPELNDLHGRSYAEYFGFGVVGYFKEVMTRFHFRNLDDFIQALKNGKCFHHGITSIRSPFSGLYYSGYPAEAFLRKIFLENHKRHQIFRDILRFATEYPDNFVLEDLWNNSQWGKEGKGEDLHFIILDAGFDRGIQNSSHYKSWSIVNLQAIVKTNPGDGMTFNGVDIKDIKDPDGNPIDYKFFTSKNSEYILSSDNQARRIKNAGLSDDGLWNWTDKTIFVDYDTLMSIMKCINSVFQTFQPVRVKSDWKTELDFQKLNDNGEWETFLLEREFSMKPEIGKHTLEFLFDGEIIKKYHPGHDVSWIENDHVQIEKIAS